ncbi:MAG: metalloprotease PmbA [Pseudomonadota bacterium]
MGESAVALSITEDDLKEVVTQALTVAKRLGADQAEVAATHDAGIGVTARLGDVENLEFTNDRGVGITVYKDSCKGSASTSDFSTAAVEEAVQKAYSFATYTASDEHAGLADADLMCQDVVDLDLDHAWALSTEDAIALAIDCERVALEHDPRISNSEGATVSSSRSMRAYGNSHGFVGSYRKSGHSLSCVVLATDGDDMHRDYYYTNARDPSELKDAGLIGETAATRALSRIGARKISTTRAPVLFVPELARGFIGHAVGAIAGGALYRRASFLLDAAGETLFPEFLSIKEQPHIPKAMASVAYDGEGVATFERDLVADGVLQGYVLSSYSARRLGLQSTANAGGAQNLVVSGNATGYDDMLRDMHQGLVVVELIGQGVNAVTGDYSRGAVGYWVDNGEIQFPVQEVTIAGNLRDLYTRIAAVGKDQDLRGGIRCGSLLVEEMTIAGS